LTQLLSSHRANTSADGSAVVEHHEGRHGLDAHLTRQDWGLIDVDSDDLGFARQFASQRFQLRRDRFAGATPLRTKLD